MSRRRAAGCWSANRHRRHHGHHQSPRRAGPAPSRAARIRRHRPTRQCRRPRMGRTNPWTNRRGPVPSRLAAAVIHPEDPRSWTAVRRCRSCCRGVETRGWADSAPDYRAETTTASTATTASKGWSRAGSAGWAGCWARRSACSAGTAGWNSDYCCTRRAAARPTAIRAPVAGGTVGQKRGRVSFNALHAWPYRPSATLRSFPAPPRAHPKMETRGGRCVRPY
jgi:hypothetical protein